MQSAAGGDSSHEGPYNDSDKEIESRVSQRHYGKSDNGLGSSPAKNTNYFASFGPKDQMDFDDDVDDDSDDHDQR